MIAPARVAAFDVLLTESRGRADLPAALAAIRDRLADERDRSLATEIAVGTLRWRSELDAVLLTHTRRPLERLDIEVLQILRLSAYQLLHLSRVPAAAVVDDAVALTKRAGKRSASGFVNAVLRATSRGRAHSKLPQRPADLSNRKAAVEYLAVTLSHPTWLVDRWLERIGFARAEAWTTFNNTAAPVTLGVLGGDDTRQRLLEQLQERGIDARLTRYSPRGIVISRGGLPDDLLAGTDIMVQDEASQVVAMLAGDRPGPLVLDTCAAPGGKATAIAALLDDGEELIACDVRNKRMDLLRQTVARSRAANISLVQADARHTLPFRGGFSTVVVDAPCSGLGTLRRDPDIKWRRQPEDLAEFAARQRQILAHAADVVAPGGRLVYATCSSEPEENEDVVTAFLASRSDFVPVSVRDANPHIPEGLVDARGHLRTEPDRHELEQFFGAVFRRSTSEPRR